MTTLRNLGAALLLLAGSAACASSQLPQPTSVHAKRASATWPNVTVADLNQGRSLYVGRCGACHQLYEPGSYGEREWSHQLAEMRERAQLDDNQERLILQYLVGVGVKPAQTAQRQ